MKIHQNLVKLDKFTKNKKKLNIVHGGLATGKASGGQNVCLRRPRLKEDKYARKNQTILHEQQQSLADHSISVNGPNIVTISPHKILFENAEPPFTMSSKPAQRLSNKHLRRPESRYGEEDIQEQSNEQNHSYFREGESSSI